MKVKETPEAYGNAQPNTKVQPCLKMPSGEPGYVEDAELDAQLSRRTPEHPEADQPAEQTSTLGRKLLPGTAFTQRLRIMLKTLVQKPPPVYR